jgi:hypothetical protein
LGPRMAAVRRLDIAAGAGLLLDIVRASKCGPGESPPQALLVCPTPESRLGLFAEEFAGAVERSRDLARHCAAVADARSCPWVDAGATSGQATTTASTSTPRITSGALGATSPGVAVAGTTEPVTGQGGAGGRVVEASDEPGGAVQPGVWQPRRGADDHLAGEAGEHLAALGIDAEQPRCTVEADRLQVPQEGMDVVGSLMQRPAHRLADPDDAVRPAAAGKGLLGQLVHEPSLGGATSTTTQLRRSPVVSFEAVEEGPGGVQPGPSCCASSSLITEDPHSQFSLTD